MTIPRVFQFVMLNPNDHSRTMVVDPLVTGISPQISTEHYMIHSGYHYMLDDYDSDVDQVTPKYWHLVPPAEDTEVHIFFGGSAGNPGMFEIFVDPTLTDDGTELDAVNNYQESTNTAGLVVYRDPTVTNDGTRIAVGLVGGGQGIGRTGGVSARDEELILLEGGHYLVKFSPFQDDTKVTVNLHWYELEE